MLSESELAERRAERKAAQDAARAKRESELADRRAAQDAARAARDAEVERIKAKGGPQTPDEQKIMNAAYRRDQREAAKAAKPSRSTGRWTTEEHDEFLTCLNLYGHNWTKAAERITTRTSAQIRSHFQKHFKKVQAAGETVSPPQAKKSGPPKFKGDPSCPDFEEQKILFPGKFRAHLPKCESCRNWAYRVSQLQAAPVGAFPTALTVVKHAAKVQDEEGVKFPGRIDVADFTARRDAAARAAKRKGAKGAAPPAKKPKK